MLQKESVKKTYTTEELNEIALEAVLDLKAEGIVKLDLRKLDEAPSDFFIICQGNSDTHVRSIADNVEHEIKKQTGQLPNHVEGLTNGRWALLDYFNIVIHVFHPEARHYYKLEELWNDAIVTQYGQL